MSDDMTEKFQLSIVVPVYNEERTVREVIERICTLDIHGGLDLIIVNDGSPSTTTSASSTNLSTEARAKPSAPVWQRLMARTCSCSTPTPSTTLPISRT